MTVDDILMLIRAYRHVGFMRGLACLEVLGECADHYIINCCRKSLVAVAGGT